MFDLIFVIIIAYLLGSIPSSVWIGKIFFDVDVRKAGSGNMGATNTMRILGLKVAIPVLIFDMMKGFIAVKSVSLFFSIEHPHIIELQMLAGITAAIGHIFPVFASFRGGKAVATLTAVILAISPEVLIFCVPVFVITTIISRYVSLGSIITTISIPFIYLFIFNMKDLEYLLFSLALISIVLLTHRKNIIRLFSGQENVISFKSKS